MSPAAGSTGGWHWIADRDPGGGALDQGFPTQGEAESWLGEVYPDLLAQGVRAVTLHEADRVVYGPMSLDVD
ncbi:hypothetical protein [uncultured Friedmanniella sp.]|uniref:hypothetical protein n=1 Tax=uncultured Friedmanniella sp. TaxID=335381 RepID=UPI0035CC756F